MDFQDSFSAITREMLLFLDLLLRVTSLLLHLPTYTTLATTTSTLLEDLVGNVLDTESTTMEIVLQLALLNLTSMDKPALPALMVRFGMEMLVSLLSLSPQQPLQTQQLLDQLQLRPPQALPQVQVLHAQLEPTGTNNNSDAFLAPTDVQAVYLVILAPLVPPDFSLTQALDSALKFVVMERDILFLVMMVTPSMVMVAAAHAKLKTDGSVLVDHLLPKIPAARASQLKSPLLQAVNPTNGEESSSTLEPTIFHLLLSNLPVIVQTAAKMS